MLVYGILLLCLTTSCTTMNHITYNVRNVDGAGTSNQNFSVNYPNGLVLFFNVDGRTTLRNNADSSVYVDMGESFFIWPNGQAERLYDNTVTTTSSSSTTGGSINLGALARVAGAGPITQTIANGTTVGTATTNGTTVQTFEERYICIPPHSNVALKCPKLPRPSHEQLQRKKGTYYPNLIAGEYLLKYTYHSVNPKWETSRNEFRITKNVVSNETGWYVPFLPVEDEEMSSDSKQMVIKAKGKAFNAVHRTFLLTVYIAGLVAGIVVLCSME